MSYSSGEAAEQVVRMTLNGVEVAAKISGKAAERLAVLLYAVLKDQKKTRGKTRLTSMLRSGKELKVFSVNDNELEKFCREAKKYGVLYCVLKDMHICEVCGRKEILTPQEAFDQGWDYPPMMGHFGVLSPRTCPNCNMMDTVWAAITMLGKRAEDLTDEQQQVIVRIVSEPDSILVHDE